MKILKKNANKAKVRPLLQIKCSCGTVYQVSRKDIGILEFWNWLSQCPECGRHVDVTRWRSFFEKEGSRDDGKDKAR